MRGRHEAGEHRQIQWRRVAIEAIVGLLLVAALLAVGAAL